MTLAKLGIICFSIFLLVACGGPESKQDDVTVTISPVSTELGPGGTKDFTATVTGTTNKVVAWNADSGAIEGTDATITYTAPNVAGTYRVTATSQADPSQTASANVTVIETPPPKPTDTPNNSATLSGAAIGDGSASTEQLRKELSLTLTEANPDFELGKAYAVAEDLGSQSGALYWVIPVTNVSEQFHCGISLSRLRFKNENDEVLSEKETAFVVGSVGKEDRFFQDNCLRPEEQGYFVGTDTRAVHSRVDSLEVDGIITNTFGLLPAETRVIPQNYTVEEAVGKSQIVNIDVKNAGPDTVDLSGGATIILLDDEGLPLYWETTTETEEQAGSLAPGGTGRVSGEFAYEGRATTLYVSVLFGLAE